MEKEIGLRISEILKNYGMSQKELASLLGITQDVMCRYISGERQFKPDMLAKIATTLHTTPNYLIGIDDEDQKFDYPQICKVIAKNAASMTNQEKKGLINALFAEESSHSTLEDQ